jgi:predicted nucleic acid-binding protein
MRGADALYFAVARRLEIPLATIDEEQKKQAAPAVAIREI